ncbi:glycoside hydrolase superfamily [Xylariomycetidae sp. FL2044]|nr:glycoside hydrolase superfamily [Xylariomycetidae sp. FL2044]
MRSSILSLALATLAAAAPSPGVEAKTVTPWKPAGNWGSSPIAQAIEKIDEFVKNIDKKNWKTFKSNGVNLGGWLSQEKGIDPDFFNKNGASDAADENAFCKTLGQLKCGLLLEKRYATYFTTADVDLFAEYGVNLLRIPIGYWAFHKAYDGDSYHTGSQLLHLSALAKYAIEKKGMHIILDLHGLPGGQNGLDNQGKSGDLYWWNNQTNFDRSIDLVKRATDFILIQSKPEQWTLSVINEPLMQGPAFFGQNDESVAYLNKYYKACIDAIRAKDPNKRIPIMLSDGFSGEQAWEKYWGNSQANLVFDTHIYFFSGSTYSYSGPYDACYLAKSYSNTTLPVFIGEWSIQAAAFNTGDVEQRALFYQTQFDAYIKYVHGGAFWNGKHAGPNVVGDDGTDQTYYWSFQKMASQGVIKKPGEQTNTITCD